MDLTNAKKLAWKRTRGEVNGRGGDWADNMKGLTATLVGCRVYVIGLSVSNTYTNQLHILDLRTNTWSGFRIPPFRKPHNKMCFLWNDSIYVYKGTDVYYRVDLQTHGKVEVKDCLWKGIDPFSLHYSAGSFCEPSLEFVIFGGSEGWEVSSRTYCLRVDTQAFYAPRVKGKIPWSREKFSSCSVRNRVYFYGGQAGSGHRIDLNMLVVANGQYVWSQVGICRQGICRPYMTVIGSWVVIIGGNRPVGRANPAVYSLEKQRWLDVRITKQVASELGESDIQVSNELPTVEFRNLAAVSTPRKIVVFCGYGSVSWSYWTLEPAIQD